MPHLHLKDQIFLEVIYQLKLVGLVITSKGNWSAHVEYTVKRVNKTIIMYT